MHGLGGDLIVRHVWVTHFVADFEHNPRVQYRFHVAAMTFWLVNAVAALVVFFAFPGVWLRVSILYVLLISLYANWDTDYDAVSASLAALHGEELLAQGKTVAVTGQVVAAEVVPDEEPGPGG